MYEGMYEGMMHGGWMMWIGGVLSLLFTVVLLALLVLAAVWLYKQVRDAGPGGGGGAGRADPVEILRRRYAEGEISEDEFRRMKQQLSG